MTTNYHTPLSGADLPLALIAWNTRFSDLDSAIDGLSGAGSSTQLSVTLGQSVGANDAGYIDLSDGEGYLLDADSAVPRAGAIRGFWVDTASSGASGTLQIAGVLSGFSSLTPNAAVYVDTTAGDITQTRPSPTSGGAQVALMELGIAISATEVLVRPLPIQYQMRDAMADTDTLTVVHHPDANGYTRKVWAYISEASAGAEATGYASANQDSDVELRELNATTTTVDTSGASATALGENAGNQQWLAQSFQVTAGDLSQITIYLGANAGTPTGDVNWEIQGDNTNNPDGTALDSGSFTPSASSNNTINVVGGVSLSAATKYWLVLKCATSQGSGNYYNWPRNTANPYANGNSQITANSGSSWTDLATSDYRCTISTVVASKDKLAQTFAVGSSTDVASVGLWLKKTGSPTGTCTVRIETLSGSEPSGTLADAAATITFTEASLGTSYAEKLLTFASEFTLPTGSYAIVLSTDRSADASNYIIWGADGSSPSYASGEMFGEVSSSWSAESKDAVFSVYEPGVINPARVSVDWWSSTHADMVNRYGDGSGSDLDDKTTFKCVRGAGFDDITVVVEIA